MGILNLDIQTLARGFQSSNNTSSNGMYFMTGYQPDSPQYSNSTVMYISNDNKIGVKTVAPQADLHVAGTILCKALIQDPTAGSGGGAGDGFNLIVVDNEIFVQGRETHGVPISLQAGDMWWDTDDNPPTLYVAASARADDIAPGEWESGGAPLALIDPNVSIVVDPDIPTSSAIGDIWLDSDNAWLAYRAESVGADEIATGEWVLDEELNNELQPRV